MGKITKLIPVLLLGTIPATMSHAQTAVQFVARDYSPATGIWENTKKDESRNMFSVHPATNGFTIAQKSGNAVWFGQHTDGSAVSPMEFPESATNFVKHGFFVVINKENADRGTLVSAPVPLRIESHDPMDAYFGVTVNTGIPRDFIDEFLSMTNTVSVNAEESKTTIPDPFKLQLVEFALSEDGEQQKCTLLDVFLGGHAAVAPQAGRSWRGAVAEAVFIIGDSPAESPTPRDLNAVRRYLSARHRLGLETHNEPEITSVLAKLEVRTFATFTSLIMVK